MVGAIKCENRESAAEVARLMKVDGAYKPAIVGITSKENEITWWATRSHADLDKLNGLVEAIELL